ncbi:cilia- and flagella-associated protein 337-like [Pholidichthys leucotaenia]
MGTRMEVSQLESRMNMEDYRKLQSLFLDSSGAFHSLSRTQFISLAWSSVGHGSKEEYGLLFDSVVISQEHRGLLLDSDTVKEGGRVDWEGLCAFLLQVLTDRMKNTRTISVPRWKPPRTLTSPHQDPVQKVLYQQSSGQYLTVSKRGNVGLWHGEDVALLHTKRLQNSSMAPKDLWITDVVLLESIHKIAVSFTSKEVYFYDMLSKQNFSIEYKLKGLKFIPWCLDFWVDPSHPDQAVLTIGDIGGQVTALNFTSAQISLFERRKTDTDSAEVILWDEVVKGKHQFCYTVTHQAHAPAWVRKVHYLGSLDAFVSCTTSPQSSLVIGRREKESKNLRATPYPTKRGVWDIDCHCRLTLIATAGVDHLVLLWNPYVASQPVCVLRGHTSPVTAVRFMQTKEQLLSYSKDKVLCLWDVSSQLCIHRLAGIFPNTLRDTHTLLFLNEEHQRLFLSFNNVLMMLEASREEKTSSHEHPVTCVIYNSLFRQVISSDAASSVIFWLLDTGQKVKQLHRCHDDAEICTLALDGTQTRLFTAGSDGQVKVWDFNGRCLHRMSASLGRAVAISQVLLLKRSILVMGWERDLTVFHLHAFCQSLVEPSEWKGEVHHHGSVLCAAFQPPHTLVTGSYDGEIIVWNSSTEKALKRLRPHAEQGDYSKAQETAPFHVQAPAEMIPLHMHAPAETILPAASPEVVSQTASPKVASSAAARPGVSPAAEQEGNYCLMPNEGRKRELPNLLQASKPHLDHVTHLEMCMHGDRLLLISASSDCSVALSYLPGETVGLFGQVNEQSLQQY